MPPSAQGLAHGQGHGGGGRGAPGLLHCCRKPLISVNAICCSPCLIGRQCAAIDGQNNTMSIMHCFGAALGAYTLCICCIRMKVSDKYGIGENCCVSWFQAAMCPCCSLVQMQKTLKRHGNNPGLVIKPPKLSEMDGPQKDKFVEGRNKRRDERRNRNASRRGRRGGGGKDSSSESDSSDSD